MSKNNKNNKKQWKTIKGYYKYKISTHSDIIRIKDNYVMTKTIASGYNKVSLTNNKGTKSFFVHRLVALAFIPNPKKLPCVDHIDNNRFKNHASNLRWCTRSFNTRAYHSIPKESRIVLQYDENNEFIKEWISVRQILNENPQYSEGGILSNLCGHNKNTYGYIWKYKIPRDKKVIKQQEIGEIFKPIPKFEGADLSNYCASNKGNIKNSKGLIMRNQLDSNSYTVLVLTNKLTKRKHTYRVNRLVAYAFIKNNDPKNKIHVNHKDKNRSNNKVENLEWTTRRYNNVHARGIKLQMIDPTTNKIIKLFDCIYDANMFLGLSKRNMNVTKICRLNSSKIYHGYKWQLNKNDDDIDDMDDIIDFVTVDDLFVADNDDIDDTIDIITTHDLFVAGIEDIDYTINIATMLDLFLADYNN